MWLLNKLKNYVYIYPSRSESRMSEMSPDG